MQWELSQIQAAGPAWKEQVVAGDMVGEPEGGFGGGGEGGIPEFGGGPADVGGEDDIDIADTDVEPEPSAGTEV